jgi:hypothetical protein
MFKVDYIYFIFLINFILVVINEIDIGTAHISNILALILIEIINNNRKSNV